MSAATHLPVIDVQEFRDTGWHRQMDAACEAWGCFQIVNHGMDLGLMHDVRGAMHRFFAMDAVQKRAIERTEDNAWGFYDQELTKNKRDWKEIFDVGPAAAHGPMGGADPQWPENLTGFRQAIEAFYASAERVAAQLLAGIANNLNTPEADLAFSASHTSFLRLNYYPRCDRPDLHKGISPHTDAGALTVLLTDRQPGLQFEHQGEWCTVQPLDDALTINIGDIVQVWSNNRYTAPLHRVLANAEEERFSAPFFYNPSYETSYAPLPGVLSEEHPARYTPINWGDFRAGRAAGDYADLGEEIQIAQFRVKGGA